jgi:hypothetical protein
MVGMFFNNFKLLNAVKKRPFNSQDKHFYRSFVAGIVMGLM